MFIEVIVKYHKAQENGETKAVNEHYLVDSLSLTEAEGKATESLRPYISGEFIATSAKTTKIDEVVGDTSCGKFFLAKIALITIDERTAKEKRTIMQLLVGAEDFDNAYKAFGEYMRNTISDFTLISLAESTIQDVF